jgi:hypothetical protein
MMVDSDTSTHEFALHATELLRLLKRRDRLDKRIFELNDLLKGVLK